MANKRTFSNAVLEQPEDLWKEDAYGGEILSHSFDGEKTFLRVAVGNYLGGNVGLYFFPDIESLEKAEISAGPDCVLPGTDVNANIKLAKDIIEDQILPVKRYVGPKTEMLMEIDQVFTIIKATVEETFKPAQEKTNENEAPKIQLARKAGYIQGVCECVAAIGDDHTLGKKLLNEMNVTKDLAKKYANPRNLQSPRTGYFRAAAKARANQQHKTVILPL